MCVYVYVCVCVCTYLAQKMMQMACMTSYTTEKAISNLKVADQIRLFCFITVQAKENTESLHHPSFPYARTDLSTNKQ